MSGRHRTVRGTMRGASGGMLLAAVIGLAIEASARCDRSAWPYPIVRHLRGELDEAGLLAVAQDDGKRGEARCYLGLTALERGRDDAALEHFRWVKHQGHPRSLQYVLSVAELDRLLARGAEGDGP